MKINKLCRFLLLLLLIPIVVFAQKKESPSFYYGFNERIEINKQPNKVILRTALVSNEDEINRLFRRELPFMPVIEVKVLNGMSKDFKITFNQFVNVNELFQALQGKIEVASLHHCFKTDDLELYPTNEIVMRPLKGASYLELQKLNTRFNANVEAGASFLKITVPASLDVIEVANQYQESGQVKFAHPDFIAKTEKFGIPNDEYFDKQFALHNTGQVINDGNSGAVDADVDAPEAWDITTGDINIIVAVIDEGVTFDHPDLPASRQLVLNGSNFAAPFDSSDVDNPSPTFNGNHGNACAGIIAATQNNGLGVTGVAPGVTIMPVRIPYGNIPSSVYAEAFELAWKGGADVLSNSWGYGGAVNPNLFPVIVDALIDATTLGRQGLGSVVTFSSGNTANHVANNSGVISFPSNVEVDGLLTVGASDRYDQQANYSGTSNTGSPNNQIIDIVAPSHKAYCSQIGTEHFEVWTIDMPGLSGYNPWVGFVCGPLLPFEELPTNGIDPFSFTGRMGGTSSAAPMVAGIAALALSLDATMTQLDVFELLTTTADDVGEYTYTDSWSPELGHGRVNAFKVVHSLSACLMELNLSGTETITYSYQAQNFIKSTQSIEPVADIEYRAGNKIMMMPGFIAREGCVFETFVGVSCSTPKTKNSSPLSSNSDASLYNAQPLLSQTNNKMVNFDLGLTVIPNPFYTTTTLSFQIDQPSEIDLAIYDLNGRKVKQLEQGFLNKGSHQFAWKAEGTPPGIYLARLVHEERVHTVRIVLTR